MGHIHSEPGQHDLTVGAYIVRTDSSEPKVLLHLHRKMVMLMPVGGHVELDETPWQAVARELEEESGYSLADLSILQPTDRLDYLSDVTAHPYPLIMSDQDVSSDHYHTDIAYAFVANGEPTGKPEENESEDFRWLSLTELSKLDDDMIFVNTKEIYTYLLTHVLPNWDNVPTGKYKT